MCCGYPANFKEYWMYYGETLSNDVNPMFRWLYWLLERIDWMHPKHAEDPRKGFVPVWVYRVLVG